MTETLDSERQLILYECLMDALDQRHLFNVEVTKVFYCGKSSKWGIPTTLIIVVKDEDAKDNQYYQEMNELRGGSCYGYIKRREIAGTNPWEPVNRKYQYGFRVYTDVFFNSQPIELLADDR